MVYDESIATRVRQLLADEPHVEEKSIVAGGLGFMVRGHLACAVTSRGLTVRVGPDGKARALKLPHVQPHRVGKRETSAFVVVEPAGFAQDDSLARWVQRGVDFVQELPAR